MSFTPSATVASRSDAVTSRINRAAAARFRSLISTPLGAAALGIVTVVVLVAVFAPMIWGDQAARFDTSAISAPPSADHLLGTDNLGRDIGLRVLVATRLAVGLAILATVIGLVAGVALGAMTALAGRRVARWSAAAINIAVAFPGLLLALFFAIIFGVGKQGAVLALGIAAAPWFARLTQTLVASVMELEYVSAAKVMGIGRVAILRRHVLPNIGEPLAINAAMGAGNHLLAFAGLSFLGIGVQPPDYDWGRLLLEGVDNIYANPAGALGPGLAIVVAGLAFNLTGEAAASALGGRHRRLPRSTPASSSLTPAAPKAPSDGVLVVNDLRVRIPSGDRWVDVVRGVDIDIAPGESVGIVGESGSGKSLTAMAAAGLLQVPVQSEAATLLFDGHDLRTASRSVSREVLADSMSVIFQDPMSSLNPVIRVGQQVAEVAREHQGASRSTALARATQVLADVRIPDAERRARQYPHEFSGGMRQRAMIAIGLMGRPRLIIADEPTTALDVTVQRQVLDLLDAARSETGAAMILISHDLGVIMGRTDRVLVMYAGKIVEQVRADEVREGARHPYTRALLNAVPTMSTDRSIPLATIPGRPPSPDEVPPGCAFAPRCPFVTQQCLEEDPMLVGSGSTMVACWNPQQGPAVVDRGDDT